MEKGGKKIEKKTKKTKRTTREIKNARLGVF